MRADLPGPHSDPRWLVAHNPGLGIYERNTGNKLVTEYAMEALACNLYSDRRSAV